MNSTIFLFAISLVISVLLVNADDGKYRPAKYGQSAGRYIPMNDGYYHHVWDNRELGKYHHVHIPYTGGYGPFEDPYAHDGRDPFPYIHDGRAPIPYEHDTHPQIPPVPYVPFADKYGYNQQPDKYPYKQNPDKYPYNQQPDKYPYKQNPDKYPYNQHPDKYPQKNKHNKDKGDYEHVSSSSEDHPFQEQLDGYIIPKPSIPLVYGFPAEPKHITPKKSSPNFREFALPSVSETKTQFTKFKPFAKTDTETNFLHDSPTTTDTSASILDDSTTILTGDSLNLRRKRSIQYFSDDGKIYRVEAPALKEKLER